MNAWAEKMEIKNIKLIPDGSGLFTKFMGMLIAKDQNGFGQRSWRYMAIINDGIVEKWWQEPGINNDGSDNDPYIETTPENCIKYLTEVK
jgi:peroxiredoxin